MSPENKYSHSSSIKQVHLLTSPYTYSLNFHARNWQVYKQLYDWNGRLITEVKKLKVIKYGIHLRHYRHNHGIERNRKSDT